MTTPTDDLAQALREIAEWKPPQVESRGKMVSMGVAIGSNGERDYFRRLAKQALEAHESRAQPASVADGYRQIGWVHPVYLDQHIDAGALAIEVLQPRLSDAQVPVFVRTAAPRPPAKESE